MSSLPYGFSQLNEGGVFLRLLNRHAAKNGHPEASRYRRASKTRSPYSRGMICFR